MILSLIVFKLGHFDPLFVHLGLYFIKRNTARDILEIVMYYIYHQERNVRIYLGMYCI